MKCKFLKHLGCSVLLLLLIPSCKWEPECEVLDTQMPAAYSLFVENDMDTPPMTNLSAWWSDFQDETLKALVYKALQDNPDIELAQQEIMRLAAYYGIPEDCIMLRIELCNPGFVRRNIDDTRYNEKAFFDAEKQAYDTQGVLKTHNFFEVDMINSVWELDIYGRQVLYKEGACHELRQALEDLETVILATKVAVAQQYVIVRSMQKLKRIFDQQIALQIQLLELTSARYNAGLSSNVDVNLTQNAKSQTDALYTSVEVRLQTAILDLAVLMGEKDVNKVRHFLGDVGEIPEIKTVIQPGFPAALLFRRPDVRAAEEAVRKAVADLGVAWSEKFPLLFLRSQTIVTTVMDIERLFRPETLFALIGSRLSYPIFGRWKIQSQIRQQRAILEAAAITYQKSLITTVRDVELSMMEYVNAKRREEALRIAAESSLAAFLQSELYYRAGGGDFLRLLNAQLGLLESRSSYISAVIDSINAQLSIYASLGGSVDIEQGKLTYN